ncbi:hypothetical protein R3W88_005878 [Solanum pinnatisectum]|uniref:Uncharacterized protein n=1 Tax=Solanum pinnatisectum TaxID=50273 RepID=A0AAV9KFZ9_9SOLN|nr:hypothetical protein R3W88_005878 [Solanum pinnatisectum]
MAIHQKLQVFLVFHIYFHYLIIAQPDLLFSDCGLNGNYTQNSVYQSNLNSLLSSLSSNIDEYGFYNASVGRNTDIVSAIVLCRGDVELQECRNCVNNTAQKLVRSCPEQKEAFGGYDDCMLQYTSRSIIGTSSNDPLLYIWDSGNASRPEEFNRELKKLVDSLQGEAANGDPLRKYATGSDCSDCLTNAYGAMATCPYNGNRGSRQIGPRCNFRYQSYRFFKQVAVESHSPPPGKDDKSARIVIISVVSTVATIILMLCTFVILMKMRKRKLIDKIQSRHVDDIDTAESLQYDLSTIRAATDNFSNANKLGEGGFGPYPKINKNVQEVAVKRLSIDSGQGDLEFKNEVLLVARLQHRNLVRLQGFCFDGTERLLVYEFVPNASLDQFLFDPVKRRQLDWERRSKIIGGVAKGILYLHEDSRLRIIHRDLKASNVLLDAEMNPKISDFGMAKLFALDETHGSTIKIVGTYGYMAPEYAMHGQFSVKSDVFSFGVLVLEIISGQKNTCFRNGESVEDLLSNAWMNWREETTTNLIDPMLRGSSGLVCDIMRCIHIALLCVQENVSDRPTMAAVVLMLSSLSLNLPLPSGPAYYTHNDISSEISLIQEYNSRSSGPRELAKSKSISSSQNEASITELSPH